MEINDKELKQATGGTGALSSADRRKYNAATCPDYALKDRYVEMGIGMALPKDCVNCKNFTGDALTMCTVYPKDKEE